MKAHITRLDTRIRTTSAYTESSVDKVKTNQFVDKDNIRKCMLTLEALQNEHSELSINTSLQIQAVKEQIAVNGFENSLN